MKYTIFIIGIAVFSAIVGIIGGIAQWIIDYWDSRKW